MPTGEDELRLRTTLVDNASGPLRALERAFGDFRSGSGAPAKLAKDFQDAHKSAKEFGEVMRSGLDPAMRGIGIVGFGASAAGYAGYDGTAISSRTSFIGGGPPRGIRLLCFQTALFPRDVQKGGRSMTRLLAMFLVVALLGTAMHTPTSAASFTREAIFPSLPPDVQKDIEDVKRQCRRVLGDEDEHAARFSSEDEGLTRFIVSGLQAVMVNRLEIVRWHVPARR